MTTPISFPSTSSNFSLPLLFAGQAQKEFSLNQSLSIIDALLLQSVDASASVPPAGPADGAKYRVQAGASGDWSGHDDDIAIQIGGAWHFVAPKNGMNLFDREAENTLHYNSGWKSAAEPTAPSGGATVDSEARAAIVELIEALRNLGVFPATS